MASMTTNVGRTKDTILQGIKAGNLLESFGPVISSIPELTLVGRCKLSVFPDEILLQAVKAKLQYRPTQVKFNDFFVYCRELAEHARAYIDWSILFELQKALDIDKHAYPTVGFNLSSTLLKPASEAKPAPATIKEKRVGMSELKKLVASLDLPGYKDLERMWGGRDGVYKFWIRMAGYWDEGITDEEKSVVKGQYQAWLTSEEIDGGKRFTNYFAKKFQFWLEPIEKEVEPEPF